MNLTRFKIKSFRSINETEWIEVNDVTALIGTNESGKTNVLLPLWKLSPANGGEIDLIYDIPRAQYSDIRALSPKPKFIWAEYELSESEANKLAELSGHPAEEFKHIIVSKDYDNKLYIEYVDSQELPYSISSLTKALEDTITKLESLNTQSGAESNRRTEAVALLNTIKPEYAPDDTKLIADDVEKVIKKINETLKLDEQVKSSASQKTVSELVFELSAWLEEIKAPSLPEMESVANKVIELMPKYVYYSNYGNLDSKIYLPRVIEDITRQDKLNEKELAKVRTLQTLFTYVGLDPKEILALGKQSEKPDDKQISITTKQKEERGILLASAATKFTRLFNAWWQQGDYKFDFQADGDLFIIWVSDSKRPEKIALEARSTGLQWFFSFYLVFLVESEKKHANAVLLLDEPGITLHPLAQKDLFNFFDNLAIHNQIIYTTHSPFMIDSNHLERVRSVYIDKDGYSVVSSDLRASEKINGKNQPQSVYPAHAALGLTVSEAVLTNCLPVLVEGESDQYYLTGIKLFLSAIEKIHPQKEIVFVPFGGLKSKGLQGTISILAGVTEGMPCILLDGDSEGKKKAEELKSGLYKDIPDKVIILNDFSTVENPEIEDIFPGSKMARVISKILPRPEDLDDEFEDVYTPGNPICDQVAEYIKSIGLDIDFNWKIKLARTVKTELSKQKNKVLAPEDEEVSKLVDLFEKLQKVFTC